MRITFVNTRRWIYPLLGPCYLSAYLRRSSPGVSVELVELPRELDLRRQVRIVLAHSPDVVCFSTFTVGFHEVRELAGALKREAPGLSIWIGGPHITSLPHTLPLWADVGVSGEGEEVFSRLCKSWREQGGSFGAELEKIEGAIYRKDGAVKVNPRLAWIDPLDTIPPPDLSLLDMDWYTMPKRFLVMKGHYRGFVLLTSRGCPYRCRFCQAASQWGSCRYHSAQRVAEELAELRGRYPRINAVNIIDDLFIGDRHRLMDIIGLIRGRNLHEGLVFNINGRANMVDDEILAALKSINVVQISYGFESNSPRMLEYLKKGSVTVEQNEKAASLTAKYGIGVGGQFMFGTPGETEGDMRRTISFIDSYPMSHVHVSLTMPLPGTELWSDCRQAGQVSDEMDWQRLDFGNPNNPGLLYVNTSMDRTKFDMLLAEVKRSAARRNGKGSILDYYLLIRALSLSEFSRIIARKIRSIFTRK